MPDLVRAIRNHNAEMQKWWGRPQYRKERELFVARNPVCIRCGKPTETPGHSHEDYRDFETYLNAVVTDKCDPLCRACNFQERYSRKPCPVCVAEKKERIHYIPQHFERCYSCIPESERPKKWARKNFHPCTWNQGQQRCQSPIHFGPVCDRNNKNAEGCDYFLARVS